MVKNAKVKEADISDLNQKISSAADLLIHTAKIADVPLLLVMTPPDNDYDLKPGELRETTSLELHPSIDGLVFAVSGSAAEMQELVDLIADWGEKRSKER